MPFIGEGKGHATAIDVHIHVRRVEAAARYGASPLLQVRVAKAAQIVDAHLDALTATKDSDAVDGTVRTFVQATQRVLKQGLQTRINVGG